MTPLSSLLLRTKMKVRIFSIMIYSWFRIEHTLPRKSLLTIYKVFLRPPIDYSDIIYDQPHNELFCEKLELVQYKARRWYKRLSCMCKTMKEEAPNYLMNLFPKCNQKIRTRNSHIPMFRCQTDCFKYSFFPST